MCFAVVVDLILEFDSTSNWGGKHIRSGNDLVEAVDIQEMLLGLWTHMVHHWATWSEWSSVVTELCKISSSPQERKSKGLQTEHILAHFFLQNWVNLENWVTIVCPSVSIIMFSLPFPLGQHLHAFATKAGCRQDGALGCVTSSRSTNVLSLDSTEDIPF